MAFIKLLVEDSEDPRPFGLPEILTAAQMIHESQISEEHQ